MGGNLFLILSCMIKLLIIWIGCILDGISINIRYAYYDDYFEYYSLSANIFNNTYDSLSHMNLYICSYIIFKYYYTYSLLSDYGSINANIGTYNIYLWIYCFNFIFYPLLLPLLVILLLIDWVWLDADAES